MHPLLQGAGELSGDSGPIYIDANLLIAFAIEESTTPLEARISVGSLLEKVQNHEVRMVASTVIVPECKTISEFIDALLAAAGGVTTAQVTIEIARLARELMIRFSLKPNDAIHLATAVEYGCSRLYTLDQRLLRVGEIEETVLTTP